MGKAEYIKLLEEETEGEPAPPLNKKIPARAWWFAAIKGAGYCPSAKRRLSLWGMGTTARGRPGLIPSS